MWLVPFDTAGLTIELGPGCYVIPWYYREPDLTKLMWLLRAGLPDVRYAARLPFEALRELSGRALHDDSLLVVDAGERPRDEVLTGERFALEGPVRGRLFLRLADDDGMGHGWLEQRVKRAVVDALTGSFADPAHPLSQLGIDGFPVLDAAELVADPVLLLDVVENALGHRMAYARQNLLQPGDYERSVWQAAGKLMVERLRRLPDSDAVAALRLLLGQAFDGPDERAEASLAVGAQADADVRQGASALHAIGLGRLAGDDFVWQSLARFIDRPMVFAGLDIALSDWPAAREPVQSLLRARRPPPEQGTVTMADSLVSSAPGSLHRWPRVVEIFADKLAGAQQAEAQVAAALELLGSLMERAANYLEPGADERERLPTAMRAVHSASRVAAAEHRPWLYSIQTLLGFYGRPTHERAAHEREFLARLDGSLGPFVVERDRIMAVVQADVVFALVRCYRSSTDLDRADEIAATMLSLCRALDDDEGQGVALLAQGDSARFAGDYERALRNYQSAGALAEVAGSDFLRAEAMDREADVLRARGELDEALRIHRQEALPVYERLGDVRSRAVTLGKVADILRVNGELDEALRICHDELMPVFVRMGDDFSRAATLDRVSLILKAQGELDEALRVLREDVLPLYQRLGDARGRALTLARVASILQTRGELDEALRMYREDVLPALERLGDARETLITQANLAAVHLRRATASDSEQARRLLRMARASAERLQLPEASQIRELQAWCGWEADTEGDTEADNEPGDALARDGETCE